MYRMHLSTTAYNNANNNNEKFINPFSNIHGTVNLTFAGNLQLAT